MAIFAKFVNFDKLSFESRKSAMPITIITGSDVHEGTLILHPEINIDEYSTRVKVYKVKKAFHVKTGKHGTARCDVKLKDQFTNISCEASFKSSDYVRSPILVRGIIGLPTTIDKTSERMIGQVIDTSDPTVIGFFEEVIIEAKDLKEIVISNSEVKFIAWGPYISII